MNKIRDNGLDAYIVSDSENIYYMSGVSYVVQERPFFIIFYEDGRDPVFLTCFMEERHIYETAALNGGTGTSLDVVTYKEYPALVGDRWNDRLEELLAGMKNVGLDLGYGNVHDLKVAIDSFHQGDPGGKIHMTTHYFTHELRVVKSDQEIAVIRKNQGYADAGLNYLMSSIRCGTMVIMAVQGMAAWKGGVEFAEIMGGTYDILRTKWLTASFPAPHSAKPHAVPPLFFPHGPGPNVAINCFQLSGYAGESERTYFISPPSDFDREMFQHMLNARQTELDAIHVGATCHEICEAGNGYFKDNGLESALLHRCGHGLGQKMHEKPWPAEGGECVLEPGMVLTVEPGIYFEGIGAYRHSDTVLITEDGYESLTNVPIDIESLTFLDRGDC